MTNLRLLSEMLWIIIAEILLPLCIVAMPMYWLFDTGSRLLLLLGVEFYQDRGISLIFLFWIAVNLSALCFFYIKAAAAIKFLTKKSIKPWFIRYFSGKD